MLAIYCFVRRIETANDIAPTSTDQSCRMQVVCCFMPRYAKICQPFLIQGGSLTEKLAEQFDSSTDNEIQRIYTQQYLQ